ncbi:MAG: AMP-binding protein, partial [Xanthobacteraceae bacterium]
MGAPAIDTFPKLLIRNAVIFAERPAIRHKDLGIWQTWTWAQVRDEVIAFSVGLSALGLKRGDHFAVIGRNKPRLYWAMCAGQALGAVPVPLYADSVAEEMAYVLEHAEVTLAIVEDQEQVDKIWSIKERLSRLAHIVYDEPRGLRDYDHASLTSIDDVQKTARTALAKDATRLQNWEEEVAAGNGSDLAIILYTSGTTGRPKGVMLSHENILISAHNGNAYDKLGADEQVIAYLPLAWVGDHIFSYAQSYDAGFCVNCPETAETVVEDRREIGTTYAFAPPRIYENLITLTMVRMEDASAIKRRMFHFFIDLARRFGEKILNGEKVPLHARLLYWAGELLVYGPLKNRFGLSRIRVAYTAGEAIGPEIFRFFRALGINLKQLYGATEAAVYITAQPDGEIYADTVGKPNFDVEVKVAENGEVLFRSPGVFVGYYKDPEKTAETKTADGWVRTGDAGFFDSRTGHLKIIDRAKDVGRLNDGTLFAPKYIENKLKFFPHIKEAVAVGDGRDMACAMINIDFDAVGNWAEKRNLPYAGYTDLAQKPEVYELVRDCIEKVNADLGADERL